MAPIFARPYVLLERNSKEGAGGLSVVVAEVVLIAEGGYQVLDIFRSSGSGSGTEFHRIGVDARSASFPPGTFADWNESKHLGQTEKGGFQKLIGHGCTSKRYRGSY